jgi:hypothetical protein
MISDPATEAAFAEIVNGPSPRETAVSVRHDDLDCRQVDLVPASSVRMEQTRWAWEGRVPLGGVTLNAGQEGSGKTTFTADVAARATRGQLPGDLYGQPVGVVYATAEDSWSRTLVPRMSAAGANLDKVYFVQVDGLNGGLSIPRDLVALVAKMRETNSKLLVLDPLGAHLGSTLDTHKDAAVRQALAPLAAYMDELCAACIAICHWSKAPTTVALDRVNGSRAFTAAARSMLAVGDDPNDPSSKLLILAKSNLGRLDVPALRYRIEGRTVTAHDGSEITTSGVAWLGEAPGIGASDIFRSGDPDEQSTGEDMADVLRDVLADGPLDRREAKAAIRDAGYTVSDKSLQRLCTKLGVTRQRGDFGGRVRLVLPSAHSGQVIPMRQKGVHNVHIEADQELSGAHSGQDSHSGHSGHSGQSGHDTGESSINDAPPLEDHHFLADEDDDQ